MIENGTVLQDRYLIEKQIGEGGMGAVYLAVDQRFGNHVAIKETFYTGDEFGDAFEREARLLNGLQHPVLPHVSDYFTENNGHFLVMQFIEGEDLSAVLKCEGAFPVKDVLRWTDSLLDALDYLHSQDPPIIHRDIKPQNLKITPRSDVILLDFGLAKLKSEDTSGVKSVFGYSRKYSPLEQIQGTGTDARSDIFSLGATAYHLLTGEPPIDVLARAAEIIVGNPDPLRLASEFNSDVPVSVANVLNSAMALNSAGRFVSAKAMRQALEHAVNIDSAENPEKLPEQSVAVIETQKAVVMSPETENFPALEAFAAEAGVSPASEDFSEKSEAVEVPTSTVQSFQPDPVILVPQSTSVVEAQTKVAAPRASQSRKPLVALIALLICVGLAAGYLINKAKSRNQTEQAPVTQSTPESDLNIEQSGAVSDSPTPETSESPDPEKIEQAKTKPFPGEKIVERKEAREEPDIQAVKTEKPGSGQREIPQPAVPVKNTRRSEARRNGEIRERVVENQPLPDIESIFTGRPSGYRNEKLRTGEGRRPEGMSEEEWKEIRRQRRQARRQRQNNPLPF